MRQELFDRDSLVLRRRVVTARTRMKNRIEAMREREALAEIDNLQCRTNARFEEN